ncbi:mitochondrial inner-membrane-bound regulator-domain-containing protein [Aspergillus taichungensis]|uniref:Mitochondrial inner-membrane-bound regulator-domain-containing protein n=1 Tax=Aspergillus taichungensis TaxID=482145 RepID=A0A2J5I0Q5_9EURO|nr:mitochondrial inner-membrane-bound regulator-domain-containing protein [Aspergillus taichungensis]
MLSRTSKPAAGLLGSRGSPICRKCALPSTVRGREVFLRYQSDSSDRPPRPRSRNDRRPHSEIKSRRRDRSRKVPIEVTALGKPGEVVVLPEQTRRRRQPAPVEQDPKDGTEDSALPFLLEEIDNDDGLEATERIESFRAAYQHGNKLTGADWEDLRKGIQGSFTSQQLSDYLEELSRGVSEFGAGQQSSEGIDAGAWRPGISAFVEIGPVSQEGVANRIATSQGLKGKELLVERILRDYWGLGVIGEPGQLDVRLPAHSLSLLSNAKTFSFGEVASLHEAKIDITHSLGLVRITGNQESCESIREIICDTMARIRYEEVDLYQDKAGVKGNGRIFSADFLSWVGKTYGVSFELGSSNVPVKLYYLAENQSGPDNARRTLNLAIYDAACSPIPFGTYLSASEPAGVYPVDPENSTSWPHRQKEWFRWGMPSTEPSERRVFDTPLFDNHETRLSAELLKLLRRGTPDAFQNSSTAARETVTAAVGKCLFQHKTPFENQQATPSQLGRMALPRIFTTDIPRVPSFLRSLMPLESSRIHRFRLVPSAIHQGIFPQLELEATMKAPLDESHPGLEIAVSSAQAVLSQNSVDYLLPESGLDLRFTRKLTRDISEECSEGRSLDGLRGTLQGLLAKSQGFDDVLLPVFYQITLPNRFLNRTEPGQDANGHTTGEYMFMPVDDIRATRAQQYEFQDQQLSHSYYESGPFLAHHTTDLSLDMDLTGGSESPIPSESSENEGAAPQTLEDKFDSFYSASCSLAFKVDRAWRLL